MKNLKIICRLKKHHINNKGKKYSRVMNLMTKSQDVQAFYIRHQHAISFITIPPRGCEHAKKGTTTGPDETMEPLSIDNEQGTYS